MQLQWTWAPAGRLQLDKPDTATRHQDQPVLGAGGPRRHEFPRQPASLLDFTSQSLFQPRLAQESQTSLSGRRVAVLPQLP